MAGMPTTGRRARVRPHAADPATRARSRGCARPARSCSARRTPRSSRTAIRRPRATRGTTPTRRAARRRARRRRSRRAWCRRAIGSQTVGSILRPAAYCGVVGLKGTHGLVPVDGRGAAGVVARSRAARFARSVADAALLLSRPGATRPRAGHGAARRGSRWRAELFDARRAGARGVTSTPSSRVSPRAGAARDRGRRCPPSFGEIHAAGQMILEVEAAAYHQPAFAKHAADYGAGHRARLVDERARAAGDRRTSAPTGRAWRSARR